MTVHNMAIQWYDYKLDTKWFVKWYDYTLDATKDDL